MIHKAIKFLLFTLAISAGLIGMSIFFLGALNTATFFVTCLQWVFGALPTIDGLSHANADGELRFYSVFWIAWGAYLFSQTKQLPTNSKQVSLALGLFFAGGIGRVLSWSMIGQPHFLFQVLMIIELTLPLSLILLIHFVSPKQRPATK